MAKKNTAAAGPAAETTAEAAPEPKTKPEAASAPKAKAAPEPAREPAAATDPARAIADGYTFEGPVLNFGALVVDGEPRADLQIRVPLAMLNRHGLVAGATGTGKTKTLQGLAAQLSAAADRLRPPVPHRAGPRGGETSDTYERKLTLWPKAGRVESSRTRCS